MKRSLLPFLPALCVALALAAPASARDLGVRGATWPVAEPDLLAEIEARLADMRRSGELDRLQDAARTRARQSLEEPAPVPGVAPARERTSRLVDPAIVVGQDIRGPDGALIAAAGTRIDPFEHAPLTRALLFVDGRREAEIAWALAHEGPAKIVLLAGRPLELMRRHRRPFFFDLGGPLTERFAVRATPTLVEREGAHLRLTEFPLDDLRDSGPASAAGAARCASTAPAAGSTNEPDHRRQEPC